jgi:hypothetical protein
MPLLDDLYERPGTAKEFAENATPDAFPNVVAKVIETKMVDGGVNVEITWHKAEALVGRYLLQCYRGKIHCSLLEVQPSYQGQGLLLGLLINMEPWWTDHLGIMEHTVWVQPGSVGEKSLLSVGFLRLPNGEFGIDAAHRPRIREFIAWAQSGAKPETEPQWRKALNLGPPNGVF